MNGRIRSIYGRVVFVLLASALVLAAPVQGQDETPAPASPPAPVVDAQPLGSVAQVRVDGKVLFSVRGLSAFPASRRARQVSDRIVEFARNERVSPEQLTVREDERGHFVLEVGELMVTRLFEEDAHIEGIALPLLSEVVAVRIRESVTKYRADRTPRALWRSALFSVGLTGVLALLAWGLLRLRRWLERVVRRKVDRSMANLERKSGSVVHRSHLWGLANGLLHALWILSLLVIVYFYLSSVLGTFPWTRGFALVLLDYIANPLAHMGQAIVHAIPDLMFLLVLWFVVRYLLRTLKSFFEAVHRGRVTLVNFEADWAMPTYRLLRIAVIAFALVVAYPYIPGSDSAAFKGISLFLGVIVSLGSTSFISNLIAGIALTYRGVFREGDWVVIGSEEGRVEEIRSQVVRLRTRDNERVSIPSSTILNANVTNLSEQADGKGLALRAYVGLGYDVAWRKAEELLLAAAADTEGVLAEPEPWVQTNDLGDCSVTHMLVVRVADAGPLPAIRTRLHRAILDRFHGAGVQIMSPSYVADPESPKVPPVDN